MTIEIIGAGLGRTGTKSLKAALEQLGFDPCYHMTEVFKHASHPKLWEAAAKGETVDWPAFFGDYQATVDFPSCLFYKELMSVYPDAKVILSVRDPECWYESTYETIYPMLQALPRWARWLPWARDLYEMTNHLLWEGQFDGQFEDRAHAIAVFNAWNAEVQATVPAEKLLVFDVKQGWEPLCAFLGVPVPAGPFPHANDRAKMRLGFFALRIIRRWTPAVAGIGLVLTILLLMGKLGRPNFSHQPMARDGKGAQTTLESVQSRSVPEFY